VDLVCFVAVKRVEGCNYCEMEKSVGGGIFCLLVN